MTVKEKIYDIFEYQLLIDKNIIKEDSSWDDLGMDSLDLVEVLLVVEEEFDIEEHSVRSFEVRNMKQLINYVESSIK